jgi:hypothetical protein
MKARVLSGSAPQIRPDPLALGHHVLVAAQLLEFLPERGHSSVLAYVDSCQRIDPLGSAVFQRQVPRLVKEHLDNHTLRWSQNDILDELLVLDVTAVTADQLHPGTRQHNPEDPGVGGIGQVEPHHLAELRGEREIRLPAH